MLGSDDSQYPTVDEALASFQRSRENLAAAWANLRSYMGPGRMPTTAEQCRWNALVYKQVQGELELLAYIAREDPDARFNGKTFGAAVDDIRRSLVLGDFSRAECESGSLRGSNLGEPITLTALGIIIGVSALLLTSAFVYYTRTQLSIHEEQTARAKEYTALQRECLEKTGSTCNVDPNIFTPPKDEENLPSWAKGLIAAGAVAAGLIVLVQVVPRLTASRTAAVMAGCRG